MQSNEAGPDLAPLREALERLALIDQGEVATFAPLAGGVASDIWLVEAERSTFVVKRALARLRVAADWRAPVSRNAAEAAWLSAAGRIAPAAVPVVLAHDAAAGLFAMTYLPPGDHPVWKTRLRDGAADPAFAAAVGRVLARLHAGTAGTSDPAAFNSDETFVALRLEPYFTLTAVRHSDVAERLSALTAATLANKRTLIHGDVSPKNILVGPHGPVFLDAECAWVGDPAFDLAFCLNHLLLKGVWNPAAIDGYAAAFLALSAAYLAGVTWEPPADVEGRSAALLPALLLARIDGKSPVEYITDETRRAGVRRFAKQALSRPAGSLGGIAAAWWAARCGAS